MVEVADDLDELAKALAVEGVEVDRVAAAGGPGDAVSRAGGLTELL